MPHRAKQRERDTAAARPTSVNLTCSRVVERDREFLRGATGHSGSLANFDSGPTVQAHLARGAAASLAIKLHAHSRPFAHCADRLALLCGDLLVAFLRERDGHLRGESGVMR